MTYTTDISNNFSIIDLKYALLISTPALFTLEDANYLKQLLQHNNSCLSERLYQQLESNSVEIILDLRKTTFIDSEGLIGLLEISNLARNNKIGLTFSNFSAEVQMVLSLIGLEQLFRL